MNIWMIGITSVKYHYLKKKIFTVMLIWMILLMQITRAQKRFVKILKKNIGGFHHLIPLLLVDAFENFRNICLEIYELDPAKFLSSPGLAWQGALKKTKVKLDLLTDIDVSLMVEKFIRRGICRFIYRYAKVKYRNIFNIGM